MGEEKTEALQELRRQFLAKRDSISAEERETRSRIITVKIGMLPEVRQAGLIGCYLPAGSEVDTLELVMHLLKIGRRVAVPVRTEAGLQHAEIESVEGLETSTSGRLEPPEQGRRLVKTSELEALVIPGVAFGTDGSRLGYGDGEVTALLTEVSCPTIAPAYDFQFSSRLTWSPGEPRLDAVIGETIHYPAQEAAEESDE